MSILVGRETRLVVQGSPGWRAPRPGLTRLRHERGGRCHARQGQRALDDTGSGLDTVAEAVGETGANTSLIFVPAAGAPDAIMEAAHAGIGTIFCITEGIPALDMIPAVEMVRERGARLIGPNCLARPRRAGQGRDHPGSIHREGRVGVVSRSGTLTYEAVQAMTDAGRPVDVGIGGDPIIGTTFLDVLQPSQPMRRPTRSC